MYGSKFIAALSCVNQVIDLCNTLFYLGIYQSARQVLTCLQTTSLLCICCAPHQASCTKGTMLCHFTMFEKQLQPRLYHPTIFLETSIQVISSANIGAMHQSGICCNRSCFTLVTPQIFLIMKTSLFCFDSRL
jgi:hypothetical protein